jgi:hypothetical protein
LSSCCPVALLVSSLANNDPTSCIRASGNKQKQESQHKHRVTCNERVCEIAVHAVKSWLISRHCAGLFGHCLKRTLSEHQSESTAASTQEHVRDHLWHFYTRTFASREYLRLPLAVVPSFLRRRRRHHPQYPVDPAETTVRNGCKSGTAREQCGRGRKKCFFGIVGIVVEDSQFATKRSTLPPLPSRRCLWPHMCMNGTNRFLQCVREA